MGDCQTSVLEDIARSDQPASIGNICVALAWSRKRVLRALGRLMNNKLVRRVGRDLPALYEATAKGRALIASGGRVTSGPKGPHTGPRKQQVETFRGRLWVALRMKRKATIPDLIEIARRKGDPEDCSNNAQIYLRRLVAAGVATAFLTRAKGFAPTSPGFKRFALLRDLGPRAPIAAAKHLFDPNSGERIPYRENSSRGDAENAERSATPREKIGGRK